MSLIARCAGLVLLLQIGFAVAEIRDKGWWKRAIIYEIFPQSFRDSNNDGYGDLKGIQDKLPYLKEELGINTILLRPIYSIAEDRKYVVLDYEDIYEKYGNLNDFKNLMAEAKNRSMKIILDFIPNHTSKDHDWFKKSINRKPQKYTDYYIWRDGIGKNDTYKGTEPNNWKVVGGEQSAWIYNEVRNQWYLSQFGEDQCDLNYNNEEVLKAINNTLKFWLEMGVDGFRMDKVSFLYEDDSFSNETSGKTDPKNYNDFEHTRTKNDPRNQNLTARWRKILDEWADDNNETEKVLLTDADVNQAINFYKNGSHVPINYNLTTLNKESKPEDFKKAIDSWINSVPSGHVANWMVGDYDHSRVASVFDDPEHSEKLRSDQMTMLTMILPGIAFTYYGEEIGMLDKPGMDGQRSVFQWNAKDRAGFCDSCNGQEDWNIPQNNYPTKNVEVEQNDTNSFLSHYKELVKLRNTSVILANGTLEVHNFANNTLVVKRQLKYESIVLLMNFEGKEQKDLNIGKWVVDVKEATVFMASKNYDGNLKQGTKLDPSKIELKMWGALLLLTKSGGVTTMASALLLFGCSLFSLSRVFRL